MLKQKIAYLAKEYLTFSSSERKGVVVLIILIALTLLLRLFLPLFFKDGKPIDVSKFKNEIAMFEQSQDSIKAKKGQSPQRIDSTKRIPKVTRTHKLVDLNSADSATLERLPGIGPAFSRRIIKYRNMLGGFNHYNQLLEVYGITTETTLKIRNFIVIDTSKISKLSINSFDFKQINAHPYISYEQTRLIFRLRSKSKIENFGQLVSNNIFTNDEIAKLRPYLIFE